jgi:GTP-binding protein
MNIKSAQFIKGVVGTNEIFENGIPQIVFIGRSNVGKSSVINSLANQKNLARTSSMPGRTQEINIFLINNAFYLVDLPGYGYANMPIEVRKQVEKMLDWYLFRSEYDFKKVIFIIDAKVGPTSDDMEMLYSLETAGKNIVIVANKIDKLNKSEATKQIQSLRDQFSTHHIIPYSAVKKIGVGELTSELLR